MDDLANDAIMIEYLLGGLTPAERDRIDDRIAQTPEYFEAMAAVEDDLIQQWHRGQLSSEAGERFERLYRAVPSRWARVEAAGALQQAAAQWATRAEAGSTRVDVSRPSRPSGLPRLLLVAAAVLAAVGITALWLRDGRLSSGTSDPSVLAVTLAAVGQRGPGAGETMDAVVLAPGHKSVQLTVGVEPGAASTDRLEIEIQALDGGQRVPVTGNPVTGAGHVTVTVAADALPNGDYLLRVRRVTASGDASLLATQPFRVSRR